MTIDYTAIDDQQMHLFFCYISKKKKCELVVIKMEEKGKNEEMTSLLAPLTPKKKKKEGIWEPIFAEKQCSRKIYGIGSTGTTTISQKITCF